MANQLAKPNHMKSFLSKKAVLTFVFSKLAFLIFGVMITAVFLYILTVQKDIQDLDKVSRVAESIKNIAATVSASPFKAEIEYRPDIEGNLTINNTYFVLESGGNHLNVRFTYPVNQVESFSFDNCLRIFNSNGTGVKPCQ